ncbi:MAG: hypothetical protein AAGK93_00085 [Pseudomonadota bacterium]
MPQPNGADTTPPNGDSVTGFGSVSADPNGGAADPDAGGSTPSSAEQDPPASGDDAGEVQFEIPENLRAEDGTLDSEKAVEHLKETATQRAERIEKYGEVPEGDATYDLTGLKDSDGNDFEIDADNPFVKGILPKLKEGGVGSKLVREAVVDYAETMKAQIGEVVTALRAEEQQKVVDEFAKLGDEGPARRDSIIKTLTSVAEDAGEDAKALMSDDEVQTLLNGVRTKAQFELLERVIDAINPTGEGRSVTNGNQAPTSRADIIFGNKGN